MDAIADYRTYAVISPITAAVMKGAHVDVTWGDGRLSPYHYIWLRDNCPCSECVYGVTREQVFEIADAPMEIKASKVSVTEGGSLLVEWDQGHTSQYDAGWLRAHAYDEVSLAEQAAERPKPHRWNATLAVPTFGYDAIMQDDEVLLAWLLALRDTGLSLVNGVPVEPGSLKLVANRISFIRESNFGVLFNVQSKAEADSNAYTTFNLPLHTDLPTRELQPGLQFLHCLINNAVGGSSTFVDGFEIAEALRLEDPEAFAALSETRVEFRNKGRTSDYRCRAPIIALNEAGEVTEIRMANFLRGPFSTPVERMLPLYRAYRRFIEMTREARFRYRHRLEAGQMWCFDNRRALHARDEFDPTTGERHFQGCYIDRDELLSRILVLQRLAPESGRGS
ncbi:MULTISPECIES: gamma-butyrobetaine dioxygenase [unclassified Pseudomonas]|uniref:gamma-butyrobetaine dioxygenase n=1 Tax=unclassified Pseudomonas TaxID=196821 RepID=UPI000BD3AD39|nr:MULTISPECIES: gamma-butyrobetaine dioxygenase [unclassified Pseudomonas]PVZ11506.1 gamma-butyrobetaine dioxygenase [Pseudomonas sp. URIL14HWK12:I12]PVZ22504.1 gamma-butyrobetaine dioxygenase [Pseudomonas sp. URIL14HWK12:I10]PVZ31372.1 gamma-butyrobetaine dioxygenase [Pseudomonas sp. URIL14HWK12:I11]SNZ16047.1 gamma-butyrobetaine dioxygenase [Pseudomonas sp. URIL14HWK12:I9]